MKSRCPYDQKNAGDMINNKIDFSVKLDEPANFGSLGWYVGSVNQSVDVQGMYYYLHDDGNVYEGCDSHNGHTGWFTSEAAASMALSGYNINNGTEPTNNIESRTMDFK